MAAPVKSFCRFLAQRRRVLIMDEYNTLCKCAVCGIKGLDTRVEHPERAYVVSKRAHNRKNKRLERVNKGVEPKKPPFNQYERNNRRRNGSSSSKRGSDAHQTRTS